MLTEKEVEHIAQLARIELSDGEKKRFQKELSSILEYVEQLNKVNTDGVEPLFQTTGLNNVMRPDSPPHSYMSGGGEPTNAFPSSDELTEKLMSQAPHKEKKFVKVKSVLPAK